MTLTKQDIDALVDGMPRGMKTVVGQGGGCAGACEGVFIQGVGPDELVSRAGMRRTLYLAAGLTASGERKPERVRCHLYQYDDGRPMLLSFEPIHGTSYYRHHPGWFVPDGAE